jgi:hypothetical protein
LCCSVSTVLLVLIVAVVCVGNCVFFMSFCVLALDALARVRRCVGRFCLKKKL